MKGGVTKGALVLIAGAGCTAWGQSRSTGPHGSPAEFFGPDAYPSEAIRASQEGRVSAKLWVDETGKVASCTVEVSSGSPSLDQQTCRIALDKVTFTPATDQKGRPIASSFPLSVRWVLPRGPAEATMVRADETIQITMSIDAAGRVVACNYSVTPPTPKSFDFCASAPVGKMMNIHWVRDGRPVGGTITRTQREQISIDS